MYCTSYHDLRNQTKNTHMFANMHAPWWYEIEHFFGIFDARSVLYDFCFCIFFLFAYCKMQYKSHIRITYVCIPNGFGVCEWLNRFDRKNRMNCHRVVCVLVCVGSGKCAVLLVYRKRFRYIFKINWAIVMAFIYSSPFLTFIFLASAMLADDYIREKRFSIIRFGPVQFAATTSNSGCCSHEKQYINSVIETDPRMSFFHFESSRMVYQLREIYFVQRWYFWGGIRPYVIDLWFAANTNIGRWNYWFTVHILQ